MTGDGRELRVRWLGRVRYRDAHVLQQALSVAGGDEYLLLLEHPHVYTLGVRAKAEHILVDPESVGAELVHADRGGDVTYHGPGQLVGYPILNVRLGMGAVPAHVHAIEQLVIDAIGDLGLKGAGRLSGYPGIWVDPDGSDPRKICAIGVRINRGRSMHGFALNVNPDISMFGHIVPCGITDLGVTSLAAEGLQVTMSEVVEAIVGRAPELAPGATIERQDSSWWPGLARPAPSPAQAGGESQAPPRSDRALDRRLVDAGVDPAHGVAISARKPEWARAQARIGPEMVKLRKTMRELTLVTVCEEAGCPNIFECWADGTATFMINGDVARGVADSVSSTRDAPCPSTPRSPSTSQRRSPAWGSPMPWSPPLPATTLPMAGRWPSPRRSRRSAGAVPPRPSRYSSPTARATTPP